MIPPKTKLDNVLATLNVGEIKNLNHVEQFDFDEFWKKKHCIVIDVKCFILWFFNLGLKDNVQLCFVVTLLVIYFPDIKSYCP
jgi:uncharacterized membrane protein